MTLSTHQVLSVRELSVRYGLERGSDAGGSPPSSDERADALPPTAETVTGGTVGAMASRKRIYDAESGEGVVRIVTETGKLITVVAEGSGYPYPPWDAPAGRSRRNGPPLSGRPVAESSLSGGRLLGCAMEARHDAELVVASFNMPAAARGGDVRGVITHTDGGSEYCSHRFERACHKPGVVQSMGRVGSCFGDAVSEAFNSVLKAEYVHRHAFRTRRGMHQDRHLDH